MELNEMKSIWQAYDARLDKTLKLNLHCLDLIQTQKIRSELTPIFWQRIAEMAFHALAIILLTAFLISHADQWRYVVSASSLIVFYAMAFAGCIKQIAIIRRMDYNDDMATIQSALVTLRTHMVKLIRLSVLCIPTFLAYPMVVSKAIADLQLKGLSFMDIQNGYHGDWWAIQWTVSLILVPLCLWWYKTVSFKNMHIAWVKDTIQRFTGKRVAKAIELTNELESLKQEAAL